MIAMSTPAPAAAPSSSNASKSPFRPMTEITPGGRLRFNFHPGQAKAWRSDARFVCVLAGTQGGKTSFGPVWLWREIKTRGPGDYLVVTPTYPLLIKKALPEFLRLFQRHLRLGEYNAQQKIFAFSAAGMQRLFGPDVDTTERTQIFFGHASDPESLESATAKAVWLDEAGQKKFKLGSWEAIQRRLSIHEGRALITTTPYDLGWLKQQLWDRWKAGEKTVDVIRFDSTENPAFPPAEFERARGSLPGWKFDLFYRAVFTRPAGLIYDSFLDEHIVRRFAIPKAWPRYLGLDFGGVNTAGVFFAEELDSDGRKTGKLFAHREYKAGGRSASEHCYYLLKGEPGVPFCVGGSHSEDQWRREFSKGGKVDIPKWGEVEVAGLPIQEPRIKDVEVGIDRVYAAFRRNEVYVFDDLLGLLEELRTYSRELDDKGDPTEKIEDKESFHHLDAVRYIVGWLKGKDARPLRFY